MTRLQTDPQPPLTARQMYALTYRRLRYVHSDRLMTFREFITAFDEINSVLVISRDVFGYPWKAAHASYVDRQKEAPRRLRLLRERLGRYKVTHPRPFPANPDRFWHYQVRFSLGRYEPMYTWPSLRLAPGWENWHPRGTFIAGVDR